MADAEMNYFPFDPDPRLSAIALDDKRLARVFHEAVMLLSRAQFVLTGKLGPYSPRVPVPTELLDWVMREGEDWFVQWVREMCIALVMRNGIERVEGYACYQRYMQLAPRFKDKFCDVAPRTFPNLARAAVKGLDFTHVADTHEAYRLYVGTQWNGLDKRDCVWTYHGPPAWHTPSLPKGIMEFLGA